MKMVSWSGIGETRDRLPPAAATAASCARHAAGAARTGGLGSRSRRKAPVGAAGTTGCLTGAKLGGGGGGLALPGGRVRAIGRGSLARARVLAAPSGTRVLTAARRARSWTGLGGALPALRSLGHAGLACRLVLLHRALASGLALLRGSLGAGGGVLALGLVG